MEEISCNRHFKKYKLEIDFKLSCVAVLYAQITHIFNQFLLLLPTEIQENSIVKPRQK